MLATLKEAVTPVLLAALLAFLVYDHFDRVPPDPAAHVNGQALGKAFAPALASSYADAWTAAALALESGKSVADSQTVLQSTWQTERTAAFTKQVAPTLGLVLPEGTEPATPEARGRVVQVWRDFAAGLKAAGLPKRRFW